MPVELHEEASGRVLSLTLSGNLSKEDYSMFGPEVDRAVREHGKVRMLVRMVHFHGWNAGALWEDIRFDLRHFSHIERLALVGDKRWEHGMAVFCKPFTTAAIRYFDVSQSNDASAWINEGIEEAVPA